MGTSGKRFHGGQAFIELAAGMLVLALVLSALFTFTSIIIRSLDTQRSVRADAGKKALLSVGPTGMYSTAESSDTVEIDPFPATYMFGADTVQINEQTHMPHMRISD